MIVDSSALIAILRKEPERPRFVRLILDAPQRWMSAASYVETGLVIDGAKDPALSRKFDQLMTRLRVQVVEVTEAQARAARSAHAEFGRGSGHRARLNFGDCFSYALAMERDDVLLFKGDDFGHTDVRVADRVGGGGA